MGLLVAGNNPAAVKSAERSTFTATSGQTTFTFTSGYQVGDIDVYLNGIKLVDTDDYVANNGSTIVLTSAAAAGDVLTVISFNQFNVANSFTKTETDARYLPIGGGKDATSYIRTPNYGISSYSDNANASLEANPGLGTQGVGIKAWGRSVAGSGGDIHYISDTRGAGGAHRFYGWNGSSWTENARLDSLGRLTIPNQPSFLYYSAGGSDVTYSASQKINVYSSAGYSRGVGYDSANSRFTCQISGVYLFRAQAWCPPNSLTGGICFKLNGTTQIGESRMSKAAATANYCSLNLVVQMYLNVNEYVEIWTGPDAGTVHLSSGSSFSGFSGHLLS